MIIEITRSLSEAQNIILREAVRGPERRDAFCNQCGSISDTTSSALRRRRSLRGVVYNRQTLSYPSQLLYEVDVAGDVHVTRQGEAGFCSRKQAIRAARRPGNARKERPHGSILSERFLTQGVNTW